MILENVKYTKKEKNFSRVYNCETKQMEVIQSELNKVVAKKNKVG